MGRKKIGKIAVDKEKEEILQEIVDKAIERKDITGILNVIRHKELSVSTKSLIAKIYLNTVKSITQRVFFKSTLRKIAKSIRQIEICLQENNLQNTAKELRQGWDKWIQKELWTKVGSKPQEIRQEKQQDEISILKSIQG